MKFIFLLTFLLIFTSLLVDNTLCVNLKTRELLNKAGVNLNDDSINSYYSSFVEESSSFRLSKKKKNIKVKNGTANSTAANNTTTANPPQEPKVCGRNIGNVTQKIEWISNPDLDFLTDADIKTLTKDEKCSVFSGLIYMVEKAKSYETELKLVKIYLKADPTNLVFYSGQKQESNFHKIPMEQFIKIGHKFKGSYCFEIVVGSEPDTSFNPLDNKIKRGDFSLCTTSQKDLQYWVHGILLLKECALGGNHLLADFGKLNQQISKDTAGEPKSPIVKAGLFYSTKAGVYDEYEPLHITDATITYTQTVTSKGKVIDAPTVPTNDPIEKKVQEIREVVKTEDQKEEKLKKELAKQLVEAKKTTKQLVQKKEIMQRLLEARANVEKQKREEIIKVEQVKRQTDLLDKAKKDIQKNKNNTLEQIKKAFTAKINTEKQKANTKATDMLRCIKNENKNEDPAACLDENNLYSMNNKEYVNGLCRKFYGESGLAKCESRKYFCDMCCGHYIGVKFREKLENCTEKCSKLVEQKTQWRTKEVSAKGDIAPVIESRDPTKWRGQKVSNEGNEAVTAAKTDDIYNLAGFVVDVATGQIVKDHKTFKVTAKLINDNSGKIFTPEISANNFVFFGMQLGGYEISAEKEGYFKAKNTVTVTKENVNDPELFNLIIGEILKPGQFRAILTWNTKPKDLDSSLWKGKEIIDYSHKKSDDGTATLDVTATNGKGPETITFLANKSEKYQFFVSNLSNEIPLTDSDATVTIYEGNKEPKFKKVPAEGKGRIWNVFNVENGEIKDVNLFKDSFVRRRRTNKLF